MSSVLGVVHNLYRIIIQFRNLLLLILGAVSLSVKFWKTRRASCLSWRGITSRVVQKKPYKHTSRINFNGCHLVVSVEAFIGQEKDMVVFIVSIAAVRPTAQLHPDVRPNDDVAVQHEHITDLRCALPVFIARSTRNNSDFLVLLGHQQSRALVVSAANTRIHFIADWPGLHRLLYATRQCCAPAACYMPASCLKVSSDSAQGENNGSNRAEPKAFSALRQ